MNRFKLSIHKLFHWEYWPIEVIYLPILPLWLYFSIKARSLFFFNAANPSIRNGGMAMESKMDIYNMIPPQYIPKTVLVHHSMDINAIIDKAENVGIHFPFIAKPDVGLKGLGVSKINSVNELKAYIAKFKDDFLIQELIHFPSEVGIFYVRMPHEEKGSITGIVSKDFLTVTGNGKESIAELCTKTYRSFNQISALKKTYEEKLNTILSEGEEFILVPFGSHTRGSKFADISHKLNKQLLDTINNICRQVPGFYFGRLDIRYNTFDELCEGKNMCIIEINGAGSIPTHIFDPEHSLFFAWYELIRHWKLLARISFANNKLGHPYMSFSESRKILNENSELEARLKNL